MALERDANLPSILKATVSPLKLTLGLGIAKERFLLFNSSNILCSKPTFSYHYDFHISSRHILLHL